MSKENKKIANPGLRLVAALFATIGTLLIAFIRLLLSPSTSEDEENSDDFILHNDSTLISHNPREPKVISIKNNN